MSDVKDEAVRDMDRVAGLMDAADGAALRYRKAAIPFDDGRSGWQAARLLAYRAQRVANHLADLYQILDEETFGKGS